MPTYNWRPFLETYSLDLLADPEIHDKVSGDVHTTRWMGFPPASADEISQLESRIGCRLPDSYRQFLATTNGWRNSGYSISMVFPAGKVEWFRTLNQDWINAYVEPARESPPVTLEQHCIYGDEQDCCHFRVEFLQSLLQISDVGDSAVYLLNPEVKTEAGEWEAWLFANWYPGAHRYRSFWDMMQAEHESFVKMRE